MNKTKRPDLKTNENGFASRRPKRCHLCKKNFQAEKYNQHFEACYRVQNQKIEDSRNKTQQKPLPNRINAPPSQTLARSHTNQKPSIVRADRPDTANKFRIKNMSTCNPAQNHSNLAMKNKSAVSDINRQHKTQRQPSRSLFEKKEQIKMEEPQEMEREKVQIKREQSIQEKEERREIEYRNERIQEREREEREINIENPEIQNLGFREDRMTEVQQEEPITRPDPPSVPRTQETVTRPVLFLEDSGDELIPENAEPPLDMEAMIANSNSIIEFIQSSGIMHQDETLNMMMAQLQQLNLIAEQIIQLNQLGRSLAFRMGNAFAIRIHELQTAIINQIGIALMRGFNGRLGIELQNLMQRQPELKVGFTQQEIDQVFEEKMNICQKECSICLQEMRRPEMVLQLQCNHYFHPPCIRQWLISSNKCPLCRAIQTHHKA